VLTCLVLLAGIAAVPPTLAIESFSFPALFPYAALLNSSFFFGPGGSALDEATSVDLKNTAHDMIAIALATRNILDPLQVSWCVLPVLDDFRRR
jgi:hypothetical protein